MPKVSQSYRNARRDQILQAALVCFSRQGFHRATMQDIVKQSRLSPGAIYNYFESKEEIIEAIANERRAKERALMIEARQQAGVARVFKRIRDGFFGELRNPKERLRRRVGIQLWAEAQRNPRILKIVRRGVNGPRKLLKAIISDAQCRKEISDQIDSDAMARFMIAAFQGFVLQLEWDGHIRVEPYLEILDAFLKTLSPSI
jgi:TetR/AcrR family transcriptional regulator, transcriptional repressor of aconitase